MENIGVTTEQHRGNYGATMEQIRYNSGICQL